jgi:hypothetical protein
MSRLKKLPSQLWTKKVASKANAHNEATLRAAAALEAYKPDDHPDIIEWLETFETSDNNPGFKPVGMHEVPLQEPRSHSEEHFRRSWNGFLPAVEYPEGSIDIKFDQLRTVDILGPIEPRDRNDSGVSLVADFTRPPRKYSAEATDANEAGILGLSVQWETLEGKLRDLVEEHAERCRKCWCEECWE